MNDSLQSYGTCTKILYILKLVTPHQSSILLHCPSLPSPLLLPIPHGLVHYSKTRSMLLCTDVVDALQQLCMPAQWCIHSLWTTRNYVMWYVLNAVITFRHAYLTTKILNFESVYSCTANYALRTWENAMYMNHVFIHSTNWYKNTLLRSTLLQREIGCAPVFIINHWE